MNEMYARPHLPPSVSQKRRSNVRGVAYPNDLFLLVGAVTTYILPHQECEVRKGIRNITSTWIYRFQTGIFRMSCKKNQPSHLTAPCTRTPLARPEPGRDFWRWFCAAFRRFFDPLLLPHKITRIVTISDVDVALESVNCLPGSFRINLHVENSV